MTIRIRTRVLTSLALVGALLVPLASVAATIEEVVVTARRQAEALSDVPISVTVFTGADPDLKTLEPQLAAVNDIDVLNRVFETSFDTHDELVEYMTKKDNKTAVALAILETEESVVMPEYIRGAVA